MSADWTNNLPFDFLSVSQHLHTWMNRQLRPEVICYTHTHSEQPWCVDDKPQPKMTTTYGAKAYGITQLTLRLRVRLICKMSKWSKDAESDAQTNQTSVNATRRRTAFFKCQAQLRVKGPMCTNGLLVLLKHYFGCVRARRRVPLRAPRREKKNPKKLLTRLLALCANQNARFLQGRDAHSSASGLVLKEQKSVSSWQSWSVCALPTFVRKTVKNLWYQSGENQTKTWSGAPDIVKMNS